MNDSSQRKSGALLSYVSIIVSTLVQLLYTPFLVKMLGQSEYGLYSLISSIIGYLTVLDLGFGNALIVYTSKYRAQGKVEEEKKLHGMFFVIFCIIGVVAGVLGLILYFNVENIFSTTMTSTEISKAKIMMLILAFNLAVTFTFTIYSSIISAYEKFTFQKLMSILNTILKPLLMIPLLFIGYKSIAMTIVITIVNIIVLLSNYFYCRNKLNVRIKYLGFDKNLFKTVFGYSFFIFLSVIVDKINWSVDQFVLGAVSGTIAVSIYSVASQLNILFVNLSTAVSNVLLPKMSKMVAVKTNFEELTNEMIKIGRIQFFIIFLMISGLILIGKKFIYWWVGPEFEESYYVALILIIPTCIPLIQNLGISIRQAMNKHQFATIINVVVALFNIIISYFLAQKYGAIGAASGTGLGIFVSIIAMNFYYHFSLKLNMIKFWKSIFKILIPSFIPVAISLIIMHITNFTGIQSCIIYGILFTVLYSITIYCCCMNEYEKNIIKNIFIKIKKVVKI